METLSWDHAVFPLYLPGVQCAFGAKEMCLICMFSGFVFLCHTPSTSYRLSLKKLTDNKLSFISASQTACNSLLFVTYMLKGILIFNYFSIRFQFCRGTQAQLSTPVQVRFLALTETLVVHKLYQVKNVLG